MKKLPFLCFIELALGTATFIMLLAFFILWGRSISAQKTAESGLKAAIQNAADTCASYESKIDIEEDLRSDTDIYMDKISSEQNLMRKAYYTNIMLTYVQNRVNMNDPKTLYELSVELGTEYKTDSAQIAAYKAYEDELAQAKEQFNTAFAAYTASFADNDKDDAGITEITGSPAQNQ